MYKLLIFLLLASSLSYASECHQDLSNGNRICIDGNVTYVQPSQSTLDSNAEAQAAIDKINNSPINKFNVDQFKQDLYASFSSDLNLIPYYAVIIDLATYKNFYGLKNVVYGLLQALKITQDEVDILNNVLANQNINLSDY